MQKQIISSMNREIILLIDYRDQFYFSTRYRGACADVDKLIRYFHAAGYNLIIKHTYLQIRTSTNQHIFTSISEL